MKHFIIYFTVLLWFKPVVPKFWTAKQAFGSIFTDREEMYRI